MYSNTCTSWSNRSDLLNCGISRLRREVVQSPPIHKAGGHPDHFASIGCSPVCQPLPGKSHVFGLRRRLRQCSRSASSSVGLGITSRSVGADATAVLEGLSSLDTGAEFWFEPTRRRGIAATKFRVRGGEQHAHRRLPQIVRMIDASNLPDDAKENAVAVFKRLGEAEAETYRLPVEKVHFTR